VRNLRPVLLAIVCLAITGRGVSWADPAQGEPEADPARRDWVDNPYAPHVTVGSTVRLGTAVGFLYGEPIDTLARLVEARIERRPVPSKRLEIRSDGGVLSKAGDRDLPWALEREVAVGRSRNRLNGLAGLLFLSRPRCGFREPLSACRHCTGNERSDDDRRDTCS